MKCSAFPVLSAMSGMCLGGGCEVALHCDAIQAHAVSVTKILILLMVGADTDHIVESIHQLNPTIRVEELPEGIEAMIDVFLASFRMCHA